MCKSYSFYDIRGLTRCPVWNGSGPSFFVLFKVGRLVSLGDRRLSVPEVCREREPEGQAGVSRTETSRAHKTPWEGRVCLGQRSVGDRALRQSATNTNLKSATMSVTGVRTGVHGVLSENIHEGPGLVWGQTGLR